VVRAQDARAEAAGRGAVIRTLIDCGSAGVPGLVRRLAELPAGSRLDGVAGPAGELWFVTGGAGTLCARGHEAVELHPDRGLWLPPDAPYQVHPTGPDGLRLDLAELPGGARAPGAAGPAGPDRPLARDLGQCAAEVTGDRRFWVLFGPGRDCASATQFVGEIPPGRAPDHSHPYDEVVLILRGAGVVHMGGLARPLAPGTCTHLPPGLTHCLENTGQGAMRVLGVFHPADSPAAKLHGG